MQKASLTWLLWANQNIRLIAVSKRTNRQHMVKTESNFIDNKYHKWVTCAIGLENFAVPEVVLMWRGKFDQGNR
jgi:hypothetical protein